MTEQNKQNHETTPDQQIADLKEEVKQIKMTVARTKKKEKKLKKKIKGLQRRIQNETRFFSDLTHELRTPLHAVVSFTNLLMMENMNEKQQSYLKSLKFSADNLMMLINNILDLHKLDENKVQLEYSEFDLVDLLNETKAMLQSKMDENGKNVKFILDMDPKIPKMLVGDLMRVSQILNNLINNAIKFTKEGHIKLGVEVVYRLTDSVMLKHSVEDTGIGIPKEKQAKIFDAFEQAEASTTREYGGTGLGLAITKKLINALGSKIELESQVDVGTKFTFSIKYKIPLEANEPVVQQPNKEEVIVVEEGYFDGFKILVVEDNPINQMIAQSFMEGWFISYHIVGNGQLAVEEIQTNEYDLVFMDLQMPVMNGFDAARNIRALGGKYAKVPIVALSASTLGEEVELSIKAGMDKFLTKPFKPEDFYKIMDNYMAKKKENEAKPNISS